eukprot:scpid80237/ scgid8199/ 
MQLMALVLLTRMCGDFLMAQSTEYVDQFATNSGHKREHRLKYQAIMTPCGLIAHLFGPMEGRRHGMAKPQERAPAEVPGNHDTMWSHSPSLWANGGPGRHDMAMLQESGLTDQMLQHMTQELEEGQAGYVVLADQGYALHRFIQTPYRANNLP